mgnify:CR=1 FL=1
MELRGDHCVDSDEPGTKDQGVPLRQKDRKAIGLALLGARQDRRWLQIDAALYAHVSRVTIGKIERGQYVLPRTLDKYAAAYGVTVRDLLQPQPGDELDDESREIGRRYRLAPTRVRQAIVALLTESETQERKR